MAEILIVATRQDNGKSGAVRYVNLTHRPESIVEAVMIAREIMKKPSESSFESEEEFSASIKFGADFIATIYEKDLDSTGYAGTLNEAPADFADKLKKGEFALPYQKKPLSIPITKLEKLGDVGLLHRFIHGRAIGKDGLPIAPFDLLKYTGGSSHTYPILWGHNAKLATKLVVQPDKIGKPYKGCKDRAVDVWRKTNSKLQFGLEFRFNSQALTACMTEYESIGGRSWSNFKCKELEWEIPLVLWANTSIGLILHWWHGERQQLGRSIITNTTLKQLPVLDVGRLNDEQLDLASEIFQRLKNLKFKPAHEAWQDEARHELDQAVLVELLGFPEEKITHGLEVLRRHWCEDPTVQ